MAGSPPGRISCCAKIFDAFDCAGTVRYHLPALDNRFTPVGERRARGTPS